MLAAEPPVGRGDLHFRLFGVPVRVHPFFWIVMLLLGMNIRDGREMVIWVLAAFVSILVHEFGHVAAFRYFGTPSRVVLYAFGGLAIPDEGNVYRQWRPAGYERPVEGWSHIAVSLAGPMAGFALAGAILAALYATGGSVPFLFGIDLGRGPYIARPGLMMLIFYLLQVNILWGILNLLPIYPLDGGQIARELLVMVHYGTGIRRSLILSTATAAVMAVVMLVWQRGEGLFSVILFGSLAYSSYATLRAYRGGFWSGGQSDRDRDW